VTSVPSRQTLWHCRVDRPRSRGGRGGAFLRRHQARDERDGAATLTGRQLYREFCGQCHALAPADAAGFGSSGKLGRNGGQSFNALRVPFEVNVNTVAERTGGHAQVHKAITWSRLLAVSHYIVTATAHHPIPALPTDG